MRLEHLLSGEKLKLVLDLVLQEFVFHIQKKEDRLFPAAVGGSTPYSSP